LTPAAVPSLPIKRALKAAARAAEPTIGRLLDTPRIRSALHQRAERAWRATDAPLFVCFGNINRSPFAAQLARRIAPTSRATSAGFYPMAGRPTPPPTVKAAQARRVNLTVHRSTVVSQPLLDAAQAIFVFDLQNVLEIASTRPRALRRTHLLGALASSEPIFIGDPHGRDQATLEAVLDQIERSLISAPTIRDAGGEAATPSTAD
jgi:protein-tyrosine-phosphatase